MVAQHAILCKVLQDKDYSIISTNDLSEDKFADYKAEFLFIKSYYEKYKAVPDLEFFIDKFPNFDLTKISAPDSYLISELFKDQDAELLASGFNTTKRLLEGGQIQDAIKLYDDLSDKLHRDTGLTWTDIWSDTSRYDRYEEKLANPTKYYISTGFAELDKLTGGIDVENENMVLAARTGQGKTQVVIKMAVAASMQGRNVAFYSGEMTADKVAYRADTFISHIKNSSMNRGDLYIQREYKKYIDRIKTEKWGSFNILTPTDAPGPVTVNTLRSFIEKTHSNMLVVDQYSLLDDPNHAKTMFEKIGNIARDIKKLQVELRIPVVAVAQMNRTKNDDGSKDTTQIGLSDMIPQYATTVLMLDRKDNQLIMETTKARDGGDHKKLTYDVDFNTGVFTYIPEEGDNITTEEDFNNIAASYNEFPSGENPF